MLLELTGKRFSKLKVLKRIENSNAGKSRWECQCICGNKVSVVGSSLKDGMQKSCGCLRLNILSKNFKTKHGHSLRNKMSPTYRSWADMVKRCTNPNSWAWKYYGGRGIKVCKRWVDFRNFLNDMGDRPKDLTLDRINNDRGYKLSNCRWATRAQQSQNRRKPFRRVK